jgi:hypothetical protein
VVVLFLVVLFLAAGFFLAAVVVFFVVVFFAVAMATSLMGLWMVLTTVPLSKEVNFFISFILW